jgi:hypothetical protein
MTCTDTCKHCCTPKDAHAHCMPQAVLLCHVWHVCHAVLCCAVLQPSSWRPRYRVLRLDSTSTAGRQDPLSPPGAVAAAAADSGAHVVSVKRVVELLGPRAEPGASTKLVVLDVSGTPCERYLPGTLPQLGPAFD